MIMSESSTSSSSSSKASKVSSSGKTSPVSSSSSKKSIMSPQNLLESSPQTPPVPRNKKKVKFDSSKNFKEEDEMTDLCSAKTDLPPLIDNAYDYTGNPTIYHELTHDGYGASRNIDLFEYLLQPGIAISNSMKAGALQVVRDCREEITKLYEIDERVEKDVVRIFAFNRRVLQNMPALAAAGGMEGLFKTIIRDTEARLSAQVVAGTAEITKVTAEKFLAFDGKIEVLKGEIEIMRGK